jgi:hypothetical protein
MITRISVFVFIAVLPVYAATPVPTRSYDNSRAGANTTESTFTPQLVAAKGLTKVKSLTIPDDPRIEAQPLYVPGLVMKKDNKPHNVVLVASMGNHVFAFDADAPQGQDLLWTSTLLGSPFVPTVEDPGPNPHRQTNVDLYGINILWGILSTPVIDLDAKRMYVVNWTASADGKSQILMLHRIDLTTGKEIGKGQLLTGSLKDASGKPVIDAHGSAVQLNADQKQRAALLLSPLRGQHKTLFIGITGGERPGDPHGWMLAVDVDTFKETAAVPTTQQGFGGGIWQGAGGPAADDQGNVYVMTGNGGFDIKKMAGDTTPGTISDFNGTTDFAEAFIRFKYQRTGAAYAGRLVYPVPGFKAVEFRQSRLPGSGSRFRLAYTSRGNNTADGRRKRRDSLCAGSQQSGQKDRRRDRVEAAASFHHLRRPGSAHGPSEHRFSVGWRPRSGPRASQKDAPSARLACLLDRIDGFIPF